MLRTIDVIEVDPDERADDDFIQDAAGDDPELGGFAAQLLATYRRRVAGAGVIVDEAGLVLTSAHVAARVEDLEAVLLDGRTFRIALVGADRRTDLAVLKLRGGGPFPSLRLAASDEVRVGDWIVAVGAPYGLAATVTAGIVSATQRRVGLVPGDTLLQTDVALGAGNAGGAIVNTAGQLVGITTAVGATSGLGFAVPASTAAMVFHAIVERGKVSRSWLGVFTQVLTPTLARALGATGAKGALVADVERQSPAAAALRSGDVLLELDREAIVEPEDLDRLVSARKPGQAVTITRWRGGQRSVVRVTLGEEPDDRTRERVRTIAGLDVRQLAPGLGVVVVAVEPRTAGPGGVRAGDVIREIDGSAVRDIADVERGLGKRASGTALLLVQRGPVPLYVISPAPRR
jgi:serine protease Do